MKQKPLKIVYYDGAITYGGALVVLRHLFGALDRRQISPRLIASAPEQDVREMFDAADIALVQRRPLNYAARANFLRRFSGSNPWLKRVAAYGYSLAEWTLNLPGNLRLVATLVRERPDLIHINNNTLALWLAAALRIPTIWQIHVIPEKPGPLIAVLMQHVDTFIAISDYVAEAAVVAGYPPGKVVAIENPTPPTQADPAATARIRQRFHIDPDATVLAHIGRIVPWKGQLEFLQAFRLVSATHPDAVALIVGDDEENINPEYKNDLADYARKHFAPQAVIFTGQVNHATEIMQAADLVVHSSISPEPFGLVIIEAMSAGTAVLASHLGAPQAIIDNGVNGYTVDVRDSHQFSQSLEQLIADPALRRRLSTQALRAIETRYAPQCYARRIADTYARVVSTDAKVADSSVSGPGNCR